MLTQFRQCYPQGSLISELITIDCGQYIVRVSVQIQGVTLATGLAAARILEEAEDKARIRALEAINLTYSASEDPILPLSPPVTEALPQKVMADQPKSSVYSPEAVEVTEIPAVTEALPQKVMADQPKSSVYSPEAVEVEEIPAVTEALPQKVMDDQPKSSVFSTETVKVEEISAVTEALPDQLRKNKAKSSSKSAKKSDDTFESASLPLPLTDFPLKEELPLPSLALDSTDLNLGEEEPLLSLTESIIEPEAEIRLNGKEAPEEPSSLVGLIEAMDFSDVIAQSNAELKRLRWTQEEGRDYLIRTYGKRSRQLLSDEELIEFLQYLQGLPTPPKD